MNLIIFDEVAISKNVLKNGFTDSQFNWSEALLAAKQMVSFGYGEQKTKKALISFCEKNDPFFNYVRNRKVLGKIVKRAISGEMRMTGEVTIYRSEIDKISTIRNFRKQKIKLQLSFSYLIPPYFFVNIKSSLFSRMAKKKMLASI